MRIRRLSVLISLALGSGTALGAFDTTDTVQIQANFSLIHDDNLFRLPDLDPRLFGIDPANKSDTARVMGIGLKLDKALSRQRLIADLNLNETTYDKNTNLDFRGGEGRLSWMWRVGNYFDGEVGYRKKRQLAGFADFVDRTSQDLVDTDTYLVSGGYQFHPRWRVAGDLTEQESTHSATSRIGLDLTSRGAGVSVTYRTPADNSIAVQARRTERSYPNRSSSFIIDNNHTENRWNAVATWHPSGLVRVEGQVGYVDLTHETLAIRDFSGVTWKAAATWDATGKLRFNVSSGRDIRLYEDLETSYVVVDSMVFSPLYAVTSKIALQGDLSYESRDYRGDPGLLLFPLGREDKMRIARIGLTYSPRRYLDLTLSYENGERKSNVSRSSYEYQTLFGSVRLKF